MVKKTNAIRRLDSTNVTYEIFTYDYDENNLSGRAVAEKSHLPIAEIFKTLVAQTNTEEYIVLVIPVMEELDLKKCAQVARVKRVELIPEKALLPLTGYVRGGCSPIGMKKTFRIFVDKSCEQIKHICVSAGKRGTQVRLAPHDLITTVNGEVAELIRN